MRSSLSLLAALGVVALAGCAGRLSPPAGGPGAATPRDAIERFMELAERREYLEMGWIFGTAQGPYLAEVEPEQVERRMYFFACLLREHEREVVNELTVPGSVGRAVNVSLRLQNGGRAVEVPFTTVRGPGDRWFLEQFDVQLITNSQLPMSRDCLPSGGARRVR